MVFTCNGDKFILDSFRLYKINRFLGWYLKNNTEMNVPKLLHAAFDCPAVIEESNATVHLIKYYEGLYQSIKYKNYTIHDILLGMAFYILPWKKINEKKGRAFDFCDYNIDTVIRMMSDEQKKIDSEVLSQYQTQLKKPIKDFLSIRKTGSNIFYELIKNRYLTENLYVTNYVNEEEDNKNNNEQTDDFKLFKKCMKKINSIYKNQKENLNGWNT